MIYKFYPNYDRLAQTGNYAHWSYCYLHGVAEVAVTDRFQSDRNLKIEQPCGAPDTFCTRYTKPKEAGWYPFEILGLLGVMRIAEHHGILGGRGALFSDNTAMNHIADPSQWR